MSDTEPAILKLRPEYQNDQIKAALEKQAETIKHSGECPNGCGLLTADGPNLDCPRCKFHYTRIEVPFDPQAHEKQAELERQRFFFELGIGPDGRALPRYGRPRPR